MKLEKYGYTPILGWSFSRYELFSSCKRKYFYNYYPKYDSEFDAKKILFLKKLTSIPLEIGNISHEVIEVVLKRLQKTNKPIDIEKFESYLSGLIIPRLDGNFFEIYYGGFEKIELDQLFEKTKLCLNNFFESNRFKWLQNVAIAEKVLVAES